MLSEGFGRLEDQQQLALSEASYRTLVETPDIVVMLLDRRYEVTAALGLRLARARYAASAAADQLALVSVWALRLGAYLAWRNLGHGEDKRYQAFRERGGKIQEVVRAKTNTLDVRSATFIDLFYGLVLLIFNPTGWSYVHWVIPDTPETPRPTQPPLGVSD